MKKLCLHKLKGGYGIKQDEYKCIKCGANDIEAPSILYLWLLYKLAGRIAK